MILNFKLRMLLNLKTLGLMYNCKHVLNSKYSASISKERDQKLTLKTKKRSYERTFLP